MTTVIDAVAPTEIPDRGAQGAPGPAPSGAWLRGLVLNSLWTAFMAGAGLSKVDHVVVQEKPAFAKIAEIYAKTPIETLKAWQAFNLADQAAPYLSAAFDKAHWEFRSATLSGAKAEAPRCLTSAQRRDFFLPPTPPRWCIDLHKWPYDAASGANIPIK